MSYTVYSIENTIDRGLGDNPITTISTPYGNLNMEGIIVPYSNVSDLAQYSVSDTITSYPMDKLYTSETITLGNDETLVNTSLNTFGNIYTSFMDVATNLHTLPPAIVTTTSIAEFGWTDMPVIFFQGLKSKVTVTHPSSDTPNFTNDWQYLWYLQRWCYPLSYYLKITPIVKIHCVH